MKPLAISCGLKGRYKLIVRRNDGSVRLETDWFDNLITNQGLNRIGTGGIVTHCQAGSGSSTPLVTDTELQSFIGSTAIESATETGFSGSTPYYQWIRKTFRFDAGVASGNVSEVGVGWSFASGSLFSRALVRDIGGSPVTITVLSDEFLDVVYELRIYPPAADMPFTFVISGVTYNCVARASEIDASYWDQMALLCNYGSTFPADASFALFSGAIGDVFHRPSGDGAFMQGVAEAYSNNSLARTFVVSAGLGAGNVPGGAASGYLGFYGLGAFQFSFDPVIPKDSTKTMTLKGVISWARKSI